MLIFNVNTFFLEYNTFVFYNLLMIIISMTT